MLRDDFFYPEVRSILRLFSIRAECTTCEASLNIENGDFTQLMSHVRVFHKVMLETRDDGDLHCKDTDKSDYGENYSDPSSPIDSNLDEFKTDTHVKVENDPPIVSIRILKPLTVKSKRNGEKKHPSSLTNWEKEYKKWDIWKHWNKDTNGCCTCKHCGVVRAKGAEQLKNLRKHVTALHIDQLDEDHQERIRSTRTRKNQIWKHFSALDEKGQLFSCNLCNSSVFADKAPKIKMLHQHMLDVHDIHTMQSEFMCSYCGKNFKSKHQMKDHTATHTGNFKYVCPHEGCKKGFMSNFQYQQHLRIHKGEKPYLCTFCGLSFHFKNSWKNHVANHTGKFNFFCSVCEKGFAIKSALDFHFRIHTGEKPYKCEQCGQGFHRRDHLKRHLKSKCH